MKYLPCFGLFWAKPCDLGQFWAKLVILANFEQNLCLSEMVNFEYLPLINYALFNYQFFNYYNRSDRYFLFLLISENIHQ